MRINNDKDGTWTYLTIHCRLPGNALNLNPANLSRKPFDPAGKVGIEHKRKLKQIFIKIYVHTKVSHPQERRSGWRGRGTFPNWIIITRHWRTEWRDGSWRWERGSGTWQGWLGITTTTLSPIFPPKQTRNHNPTARNLSTLNTFSQTIHIALLRERRPSQDCLTVR